MKNLFIILIGLVILYSCDRATPNTKGTSTNIITSKNLYF